MPSPDRRRSRRAPVGAAVAGVAAASVAARTYTHRLADRRSWSPPQGSVIQTSSLSVRVLGEAGPPILLLHGLVASGIFWGGAYDGLAARHRLIVPDMLGFGRSPRPGDGYRPDDHAGAVVACLDDLGIDEPVVIGAHSLGSLIALRLATTHPDRVHAIVAFGPPLYPDAAAARAHVTATSPMARLFVLPGPAAERACLWACDHRALAARIAVLTHPRLPPEIAADGVQHTWTSYSLTLQQVILAGGATTWLDHVDCPVHLVAGDDDPVADHAHLRRVTDSHGNIELHERPGGHNIPLTDPAPCAAMIEAAWSSR